MMKPKNFFNLEVLADAGSGDSMSASILAGSVLKVLHGAFRQNPGRYALALPYVTPKKNGPPGRVLRVFANDRDDLDSLVANISEHPIIRDYTQIGYPRPVSTLR